MPFYLLYFNVLHYTNQLSNVRQISAYLVYCKMELCFQEINYFLEDGFTPSLGHL